MKHYEMMYIVDPNAEDLSDGINQKIEEIITSSEGQLLSFEKIGKKRLSYPINKRLFGTYFLTNFTGTGNIVQTLEYYLRLNPNILRFIVLAFSEKEIKLRNLTERIQEEEAERMRLGGRPLSIVPENTEEEKKKETEKTEDASGEDKATAVEEKNTEEEITEASTTDSVEVVEETKDSGSSEQSEEKEEQLEGSPEESESVEEEKN